MGGWALLLMPVITFVLIPVIELLWDGSTFNFDDHQLKSRQKETVFDWLIYAIVPLQLGVVGALVYFCSVGHYSTLEFFMAVFSAGLCCGAFGINVAHEFGHRKNKFDQFCAKDSPCCYVFSTCISLSSTTVVIMPMWPQKPIQPLLGEVKPSMVSGFVQSSMVT